MRKPLLFLLAGSVVLAVLGMYVVDYLEGATVIVERSPRRVIIDQGDPVHGTFGAVAPRRIIFDTDIGNDLDDALALALLHAFVQRREAVLLAVTISKNSRWPVPFVDLVNTFYGGGDVPIGSVKSGEETKSTEMIRYPAERTHPDGTLVYPHDLTDGTMGIEAVELLRCILAQEADGAVTIIQVGNSANMAHLLGSPGDACSPLPGDELVQRKVRLLSVMAGDFRSGRREFNVTRDLPAAQVLFATWPTPVVVSGFELGIAVRYPVSSIAHHFSYVQNHPIVDAYRAYYEADRREAPQDQALFDPMAVLYAVRPEDHYFSLSEPGQITVEDQGRTVFLPRADGRHRYLRANYEQRKRILEALVYLISQPNARPVTASPDAAP